MIDAETLEFLDQRERSLLDTVAEAQAALERAAASLESVRRAKSALVDGKEAQALPVLQPIHEETDRASVPNMTRIALRERFPDGATTGQLLAYFQERWARTFSKNGVSVQLSRLKEEGHIQRVNDVWIIAKSDADKQLEDLHRQYEYYQRSDPEMANDIFEQIRRFKQNGSAH